MIRMISRVAAAAVIAAAAVPSGATAHVPTPDEGNAPEVRVVNNNAYRIRVVLVDADGRHRTLGYVSSRNVEIFSLDESVVDGRTVRVKVIVDEPVWSAANSGEAVRSRGLLFEEGSAVQVWVERDLTQSIIEMRSGPGA